MKELEYEVSLTPQVDGGFTVSVPDLPAVTTEADSREEPSSWPRTPIEGYLEAMVPGTTDDLPLR